MNVYLLDENFEQIYTLDKFESLIWTDRYWLCGDFQIITNPNATILTHLLNTKYLRLNLSEHKMILEDIDMKVDFKDGKRKLTLSGRSLESVLDRRIAWFSKTLSGNLQTELQALFADNLISPTDTDRTITLQWINQTDTAVTTLTIDTQVHGETLYKILSDICKTKGIGFSVNTTIIPILETLSLTFLLYAGKDRSLEQTENDSVSFTSKLDNLLESNYMESDRNIKTVALAAGAEGVGGLKVTTVVSAPGGSLTGLNRREIFINTNVSMNTDDEELTEEDYIDQIAGKGTEELAKYKKLKAFSSEVSTKMYSYGEDFGMGDIVQITDEYGHSEKSRVIEVIYSEDVNGIKVYPTFESIN